MVHGFRITLTFLCRGFLLNKKIFFINKSYCSIALLIHKLKLKTMYKATIEFQVKTIFSNPTKFDYSFLIKTNSLLEAHVKIEKITQIFTNEDATINKIKLEQIEYII